MKLRIEYKLLAIGVFLGLASTAFAQSGLTGDIFTFSADNFPNEFGRVTDPVSGVVTDHGTPPVPLTFDGVAEPAGGMMVNERVVNWEGQPNGITVYHDLRDVEQDLLDWESSGEVVEFSFQTVDGGYIANDEFLHSFFAVRELDWAHSEPESQPSFFLAGWYFYFSRDGVAATDYATTLDTDVFVGPHPFDTSIPEVAYIEFAQDQVDGLTEPYPGGMDLTAGTTHLDENQGSWAALADAVGLIPLEEINGQPANGFHWGFLVDPPEGSFPANVLRAGDADQDLDFDQLDLIKVQQAAKYLTGQTATWGDGDWNGAPGGSQGNPPAGDGVFDQLDIIRALAEGIYLSGKYQAVQPDGNIGDPQTSVVYDANTGSLAVDAPTGIELTSVSIDSASGIFTGDSAVGLGGTFDIDSDMSIFKATFGGSFGSVSFGNVAQPGLDEQLLLGDLTVMGSLAGGGGLGEVDLVYVPVPEPCGMALLLFGVIFAGIAFHDRRRGQ